MAGTLLAAVVAFGVVPSSNAASDVSPGTFSRVSSGVALIKTYSCGGKLLGQGTGFLVGSSVVMTARHVIHGSCKARIRVGGETFYAKRAVSWYGSGASASAADIATLKLDHASDGFVFRVRTSRVPVGANLGMVGYPLGNRLSLNQGKLIWRGKQNRAPLIAVRMLGAEGASGSPFIDELGRVVGILQIGLGSKDVLGQRTAGVLMGLDLVRWWGPHARLDLCDAYPNGGIAGCNGSAPPPPPTTETIKVTAASVSLAEDGPAATTFVSAPTLKLFLRIDFAAPTKTKHTEDDYAIGPSGERVEGCGGALGVGWEGFVCDYELSYPAPGAWKIVYTIDGRQRAVGFQVTMLAPPPPPPASPHIQQCWSQYSGGSTANWNPASATSSFSASDILARGGSNFDAIAFMNPAPTSDILGRVTVTLIQPNGQTFATATVSNWQAGYTTLGYDFRWTWSDGSLFFQHPEVSGQGTWTWLWTGPDGQTCSNRVLIS